MKNIKLILFFSGILPILFGSCSSMPEHAKLIPANAVVVAGLNTKEIGKKIAWNAILGSKLFDEMKKQQPAGQQDVFNPEKMGIELMSTSYVYIKSDSRFGDGNKVTALIPLEDATKWETFVKTTFPEAIVKANKDHKSAMLADGMYAGWNEDLLIIMNTPGNNILLQGEEAETDSLILLKTITGDNTILISEMDNAFHTAKENSLTENAKFTSLEKNGHDITLWINYDVLMGQYAGKGMSDMIGLPLSNAFWKDAALAVGFDFEKGKITGDMNYYMPEEMKEVGVAFGKQNIDKDMMDRLPDEELDMLIGWHISPEGIKGMLEKMGVLGFINLALTSQNLSADNILEAFTGDMVMSVNKFRLDKKQQTDTLAAEDNAVYDGGGECTYVIKINKKESFNKLLSLAVENGLLTATGSNRYMLAAGDSTLRIAINDTFLIVSNKEENVTNYLSAKYKNNKLPEAADDFHNYPMGMYFNAMGMMNTINTGIVSSSKDSSTIAESKKLLQDVIFKGGKFSKNAFNYTMSINFLNKNENSLLLLMDFATKINKARTETLMANK